MSERVNMGEPSNTGILLVPKWHARAAISCRKLELTRKFMGLRPIFKPLVSEVFQLIPINSHCWKWMKFFRLSTLPKKVAILGHPDMERFSQRTSTMFQAAGRSWSTSRQAAVRGCTSPAMLRQGCTRPHGPGYNWIPRSGRHAGPGRRRAECGCF